MTATKQLTVGAVCTLTTGIVMVHGFAGVTEAAEWVMGCPVWTHELPMLGDTIKERLLAQHPDLPTTATAANWQQVLHDAQVRYGRTIEVAQGTSERTMSPVETLPAAIAHAKGGKA